MSVVTVFLDTPILREAFVKKTNGTDWRQEYKLPSDAHLITAHKCIAEMYGILKTSILDTELASYGLVSSKRLREMIFDGDDFLNIFWHHQELEFSPSILAQPTDANKHRPNYQMLVEWRTGYEQARRDFDEFLKQETIGYVHYGALFARHEWQGKFDDLAIETLIPSEDLEIVLAAWFAKADIFLTRDNRLIRFSFSLPLEPGIPAFCKPEEFEQKWTEKRQGVIVYSQGQENAG